MDILLLGDELKTVQSIKKGFVEAGYVVDVADGVQVGKHLMINKPYSLAIITLMLPGTQFLGACRELKNLRTRIPIFVLSSLNSTYEILTCFDCADDYLEMPFEFKELMNRATNLMLPPNANQPLSVFEIADLKINLGTRVVPRGGKIIDLSSKEYDMLEYLVKNLGRVISRTELAQKIWRSDDHLSLSVVDTYFRFLTRKIDWRFEKTLISSNDTGYFLTTKF